MQISRRRAERKVLARSQSMLRVAMIRMLLSMEAMSSPLQAATKASEKHSSTVLRIMRKQFSMNSPISLHSNIFLHATSILSLEEILYCWAMAAMISALSRHSMRATSLLDLMINLQVLQASARQMPKKARRMICTSRLLREMMEQRQEQPTKESEETIQLMLIALLRSIAVISPLILFRYSWLQLYYLISAKRASDIFWVIDIKQRQKRTARITCPANPKKSIAQQFWEIRCLVMQKLQNLPRKISKTKASKIAQLIHRTIYLLPQQDMIVFQFMFPFSWFISTPDSGFIGCGALMLSTSSNELFYVIPPFLKLTMRLHEYDISTSRLRVYSNSETGLLMRFTRIRRVQISSWMAEQSAIAKMKRVISIGKTIVMILDITLLRRKLRLLTSSRALSSLKALPASWLILCPSRLSFFIRYFLVNWQVRQFTKV